MSPYAAVRRSPGPTVLHNFEGGSTTIERRLMIPGGLNLFGFNLTPPSAALATVDAALVKAGGDLTYFGRMHESRLSMTVRPTTSMASLRLASRQVAYGR
jgi:hypothetical protein